MFFSWYITVVPEGHDITHILTKYDLIIPIIVRVMAFVHKWFCSYYVMVYIKFSIDGFVQNDFVLVYLSESMCLKCAIYVFDSKKKLMNDRKYPIIVTFILCVWGLNCWDVCWMCVIIYVLHLYIYIIGLAKRIKMNNWLLC